ncbi:hypothetical protein BH11MYX3_BH11MYX3_22740 [soil metagenome]
MKPTKQPRGSERARDEQRTDGGPRYGGEDWKVADERGDNRYGHARNDDAELSELKGGEGDDEDQEGRETSAAEDDDRPIGKAHAEGPESGGERAGMGRAEEPRKTRDKT